MPFGCPTSSLSAAKARARLASARSLPDPDGAPWRTPTVPAVLCGRFRRLRFLQRLSALSRAVDYSDQTTCSSDFRLAMRALAASLCLRFSISMFRSYTWIFFLYLPSRASSHRRTRECRPLHAGHRSAMASGDLALLLVTRHGALRADCSGSADSRKRARRFTRPRHARARRLRESWPCPTRPRASPAHTARALAVPKGRHSQTSAQKEGASARLRACEQLWRTVFGRRGNGVSSAP